MATLKLKGCHFIVAVPVYNLSLLVILGHGKDKAKSILSQMGGDPSQLEEHKFYGGLASHEAGTNRFLLHFPDRMPTTVEHYADLQHEIRHLTDYMMEHVGMVFNLDHSSEAYAYLTGYLTEEIYKRLWQT